MLFTPVSGPQSQYNLVPYKYAKVIKVHKVLQRQQILMLQNKRAQEELQPLRDLISQDYSQLKLEGIEIRTVRSLKIKGKYRVVLRYWSKRKDVEEFLVQRYNDPRLIVEYTNTVNVGLPGRVSPEPVTRKI